MSGLFYDATRLVGKIVGEVVTAPEQIAEGILDAMDEVLEEKK